MYQRRTFGRIAFGAALAVLAGAVYCIAWRADDGFRLPATVNQSSAKNAVRERLSQQRAVGCSGSWTNPDGWYKTTASLRDLTKGYEALRTIQQTHFPDLQFYQMTFRTNHVVWPSPTGGASFSRGPTVIVHPKSGATWVFDERGLFDPARNGSAIEELSQFLATYGFTIEDGNDAEVLWRLFCGLVPAKPLRAVHRKIKDNEWCIGTDSAVFAPDYLRIHLHSDNTVKRMQWELHSR
ncbi:MAG: hypothetical protein Fues2KO_51550 [Fuerstiella sp.]